MPRAWSFPEALQPRADRIAFDLDAAMDAIVLLRAEVPEDAFTAPILGTERTGYGIVIGKDGLILTIGYLITEAERIWLTTNRGTVAQAHALAYDQVTGLGLVQPMARWTETPLPIGSMKALSVGDEAYVLGHGGRAHALSTKVVAKREFAGYWEYVLDEALFTAPAHPQWGGAALVDREGRLVGVGSLLVQEALGGSAVEGNMFVPIDLLGPVLASLREGKVAPPRPWLGLYATELEGRLVIGGLANGGPADIAGLAPGDVVVRVGDAPVTGLADFFRKVWQRGPAGTGIPLGLNRKGRNLDRVILSADRNAFLRKPRLH